MAEPSHRFTTARLLVDHWHSLGADDWCAQDLADVVCQMLTEAVVAPLPPTWQGHYDRDRALAWIAERDSEGETLLVIEVASGRPIGLIILFDAHASGDLRLGYLLAESSWGKGFASELIAGLAQWGRGRGVRSITGGVAFDNPASSRVLEKNGFVLQAPSADAQEHIYKLEY